MLVKQKIIKIIDEIQDEQTLEGFLSLITCLKEEQEGSLYKSLSKKQKDELLISYEESLNSFNLLEHSKAREGHSKWL